MIDIQRNVFGCELVIFPVFVDIDSGIANEPVITLDGGAGFQTFDFKDIAVPEMGGDCFADGLRRFLPDND